MGTVLYFQEFLHWEKVAKEFPIKNIPHRTVFIRGQQGEMPADIILTLSFVSSSLHPKV